MSVSPSIQPPYPHAMEAARDIHEWSYARTQHEWTPEMGCVRIQAAIDRVITERARDAAKLGILNEENFRTVCQALADLQTALVDASTEGGSFSPRLDAALRASWKQWTPDDLDPTINLNATTP